MYYRYKTNKRKFGFVKWIAVLLIIASALYWGYQYRGYLAFWKISTARVERQVYDAVMIDDPIMRKKEIDELGQRVVRLRKDSPLSSDAFKLSGLVHYYLAWSEHGAVDFTQLVVDEKEKDISDYARQHYLKAIIYFQKSWALRKTSRPDRDTVFLFARALYSTSFYESDELFEDVLSWLSPDSIKDREDRRFYGRMLIAAGSRDQGIAYLEKYGDLGDSIDDQLFYARALYLAQRYTEAMEKYMSIVAEVNDSDVRQHIWFSMARIYYRRYLYPEALEYIDRALDGRESHEVYRVWKSVILASLNRRVEADELIQNTFAQTMSFEQVRDYLEE